MIIPTNDWYFWLQAEIKQPYFLTLSAHLNEAYRKDVIYPRFEQIFACLALTSLNQVKVVILGQDPYHQPNQACGLSFAVPPGVALPPSLINIYQELATDLGIKPANHGDLTAWANQGVLLLNSVLTVSHNQPNSHHDWGWEQFTDHLLQYLHQKREQIVYILWGKAAQNKAAFIDPTKNLVLKAPHPSPLSAYRGFFGSRPFSQTNNYLIQHEIEPINWRLTDV